MLNKSRVFVISLFCLILAGNSFTSLSQTTEAVTVTVSEQGDSLTEVAVSKLPVLTLQECLDIALSNNPTIKIADLEIERLDYSKKDVLAQLLPTVAFGANYNRTLAKQVAYMDFDMSSIMGGSGDDIPDTEHAAASSSNQSEGIKMGRDNAWQLGFSASMPLIAPQLWSTLKLSDSQIAQSAEQARASRLDLINQVSTAYYQLLLAYDSKRVIQESYDMAALTYKIYSQQYAVGAASEYDVLRTSVAMKNVEPELLQADIAIRRSRLQLQVLLGTPEWFEFDVAGKLSDYEGTMYSETLALESDYSRNSSLIMNNLQMEALNRSLHIAKMAFIPTLALSASYNWTSSSNGSPFTGLRWSPYSIVGLTLNVPLYQGGSRMNKVKSTRLQMTQLELTRDNLEHSIAMQVALAVDNIKLNVKQIASNSESVGQAERAHNIMEQSFKIGAASYLDLRDAELALTRTRLTYYQSIYNYLIARCDLNLLLGRE